MRYFPCTFSTIWMSLNPEQFTLQIAVIKTPEVKTGELHVVVNTIIIDADADAYAYLNLFIYSIPC